MTSFLDGVLERQRARLRSGQDQPILGRPVGTGHDLVRRRSAHEPAQSDHGVVLQRMFDVLFRQVAFRKHVRHEERPFHLGHGPGEVLRRAAAHRFPEEPISTSHGPDRGGSPQGVVLQRLHRHRQVPLRVADEGHGDGSQGTCRCSVALPAARPGGIVAAPNVLTLPAEQGFADKPRKIKMSRCHRRRCCVGEGGRPGHAQQPAEVLQLLEVLLAAELVPGRKARQERRKDLLDAARDEFFASAVEAERIRELAQIQARLFAGRFQVFQGPRAVLENFQADHACFIGGKHGDDPCRRLCAVRQDFHRGASALAGDRQSRQILDVRDPHLRGLDVRVREGKLERVQQGTIAIDLRNNALQQDGRVLRLTRAKVLHLIRQGEILQLEQPSCLADVESQLRPLRPDDCFFG
eukprot:scaffold334_cov241-Pinguiococcus_pyrenoidosus.AAC.5